MLSSTRVITTVLLALTAVSSGAPTAEHLAERKPLSLNRWYSRTKPLKNGSTYKVEQSNADFGMTRSTRLSPEGFTALFLERHVVIDSMGRALDVEQKDYDRLKSLVADIAKLPVADTYQNLWSVKQAHSDWPIDGLHFKTPSGSMYTISIYGHDGRTTTLESPVGRYTELPPELNRIFTLVKEARGNETGTPNTEMIAQARAVLPA
ncbi:hypothetical protein FRC09_008829 [Ceratobasidium sp. 395]|nr:hypothetical protein FRC09_008829 [Ceratobasidium sp. 395]